MLKTMRRNVKSLKPILWLIVATFVVAIFAIVHLGMILGVPVLLAAVIKVTGALSAVFSNDVVCLAVAPVLSVACRRRGSIRRRSRSRWSTRWPATC